MRRADGDVEMRGWDAQTERTVQCSAWRLDGERAVVCGRVAEDVRNHSPSCPHPHCIDLSTYPPFLPVLSTPRFHSLRVRGGSVPPRAAERTVIWAAPRLALLLLPHQTHIRALRMDR